MPKYTPTAFELNLRSEGVVFDVGSLMDALMRLHDQRDARGVRYALVTVLVFVFLAKLSGEDSLRGMAQWVKERAQALAGFLGLAKAQAPHHTTYGRILGRAVDVEQFEQVLHDYVAALPQAGQTVQIALDGKTLRGTIPTGATQGVHLLTAYFPEEGLVFAQVEVGAHENEITAAPRLLGMLDLRGKIVTADALLTQRQIAIEIVARGGEYVLPVKANQPELREDIQTLFADKQCAKGGRPLASEFDRATEVEKGHGRIEKRTLTVSSALKGYVRWPYAEQVFCVEREFKHLKTGVVTREVTYGITSLTAQEADAKRLLRVVRRYWGIESGLHYRRDVTLHEDRSRVRQGRAPQMLAAINNVVLGLWARCRYTNAAEARRHFAAHLAEAVQLILRC